MGRPTIVAAASRRCLSCSPATSHHKASSSIHLPSLNSCGSQLPFTLPRDPVRGLAAAAFVLLSFICLIILSCSRNQSFAGEAAGRTKMPMRSLKLYQLQVPQSDRFSRRDFRSSSRCADINSFRKNPQHREPKRPNLWNKTGGSNRRARQVPTGLVVYPLEVARPLQFSREGDQPISVSLDCRSAG